MAIHGKRQPSPSPLTNEALCPSSLSPAKTHQKDRLTPSLLACRDRMPVLPFMQIERTELVKFVESKPLSQLTDYQELMKESSRMPLFDLRKLNSSLPPPSVPKDFVKMLIMGASDDFIVVRIGFFPIIMGTQIKSRPNTLFSLNHPTVISDKLLWHSPQLDKEGLDETAQFFSVLWPIPNLQTVLRMQENLPTPGHYLYNDCYKPR
ncbi:hypothetical protein ACLOJK_032996 [Asimina triloba]